jgi:hypothetical protein
LVQTRVFWGVNNYHAHYKRAAPIRRVRVGT